MRSPAVRGVPALALLALVLVLAASGGVVGAQEEESPATTMRIELEPDGDARWTVTMQFELDSEDRIQAFDRLAREFEDGESDVLSVDPYRQAATEAGNVTGRSMEIRDVSRNAERANETGVLELSFAWTSFTRRADGRLYLGDVFRTESGTWLPGLDENQALIVEFPESFSVVDSSHNLENRAYEIRGPTTFEPGMPSATLIGGRSITATPGNGTASPGTNGSPNGSVAPGIGEWPVLGVGALVVLVGALALLVEHRRRTGDGEISPGDGGAGSPPDGGVGSGGEPDGVVEADEDGDGAVPTGSDGSREEPLLSDDERVLKLLHRNDGRMKQARIVEETGWSNAKVSQLLSEMAEEDAVDKLRIGRENLISLPGEGPDEGE